MDYDRYLADLSTTTALGGLHLRTGSAGEWSWSAGLGGMLSEGDSASAVAFGLHFGITDDLGFSAKISRSLNGDSTSYYFGIEGTFR